MSAKRTKKSSAGRSKGTGKGTRPARAASIWAGDGGGRPTAPPRGGGTTPAAAAAGPGAPELIVVRRTGPVAIGMAGAARPMGAAVPPVGGGGGGIDAVLREEGARMHTMFSVTQPAGTAAPTRGAAAAGRPQMPGMMGDVAPGQGATFFRVAVDPQRVEHVARRLRDTGEADAVYVKPPAEPARLNPMTAVATAPPAPTADFTARQIYLNKSPAGIDAVYAWTRPGGRGTGVRIVDVEGEWRHTHEDLSIAAAPIAGTSPGSAEWRNHGTAVTGVIAARRNGRGVTGICNAAKVRCVSIFGAGRGSAVGIRDAADALRAGDILLIELHRPGPRHNFANRPDQLGYVAVEWWPDDYAAVLYATSKGVIVVEAGGNGAEDLDDQLYDVNPGAPNGPFPAWWRNPYRRAPLDSGAVVVGAGAPPPGTHGANHGPDRSRLDFSNYGKLIEAQGWGREVTTAGYGDLQGGTNENVWYTDEFSGTSSASPVVVGALGCVQGVLRAAGKPLLTPASARKLLRTTGSAQKPSAIAPVTQRIGNRPNLRRMIAKVLSSAWVPGAPAAASASPRRKKRRAAAVARR